jgi:hypothetical protein|tara:strand:+ start:337 stop:621 length:285 start_codon:yes stop_codon:yes gene_type:complete
MPIYSYKNKKTGKVWDEYLSFDDRTKPLRNKSVEMVITAPRLSFIERREHGTRDQMIHSARESMRERQKEENAGFRDSPDWLRERTEKHLQKVK